MLLRQHTTETAPRADGSFPFGDIVRGCTTRSGEPSACVYVAGTVKCKGIDNTETTAHSAAESTPCAAVPFGYIICCYTTSGGEIPACI